MTGAALRRALWRRATRQPLARVRRLSCRPPCDCTLSTSVIAVSLPTRILLQMSTQDQRGVPVSVAHAQRQFRLLELPESLLELLASPNPPV